MIGYIARDANSSIWFHKDIPEYDSDFRGWISDDFMELKDEEFPEFKNLCYKDKPIKVELSIKRV